MLFKSKENFSRGRTKKEQPLDDPYFYSDYAGYRFRYESPAAWQTVPLVEYSDIREAHYPPTQGTFPMGEVLPQFPVYDMLIKQPGRAPLLFSGAHNRLLYNAFDGVLNLQYNSNRVLINGDYHDDINSGFANEDNEIHIGNWVSHGVETEFWGDYILLDGRATAAFGRGDTTQHTERIKRRSKTYDMAYTSVVLHQPEAQLQQTLHGILASIGSRPFVYTHDADSLAGWSRKFDADEQKILHTVLSEILSKPNLEALHFTASPAYCPHEEAEKEWDAYRQIVAEL